MTVIPSPYVRSVLVTGATGFLGGAVARDLVSRGVRVVGCGRDVRSGQALEEDRIAFSAFDLAQDLDRLERLVAGHDSVVHCAALSSPWGRLRDFVAANVTATQNVIQACERGGVKRLVHISSPSVLFAFENRRGLTESEPWTSPPANHYVATKRQAENLVQNAASRGVPAVVLRPKALFGPGDNALLPRALRVAKRGTFPELGDGDPAMDLTWIGDAVDAVRLALEAPPECLGRTYHITSGDPQPRGTVFRTVFEACGLRVRFRRVDLRRALAASSALEAISRTFTLGFWEPPFTRYSIGALGFERTLDIRAARDELGYQPDTSVLARLRDTGTAWMSAMSEPEDDR